MKENDTLSPFLSDKKPNKEIEKLYDIYRGQFLGYAHKNFTNVSEDVIIDIYQESFITLYEYIRTKRLTADNLTVSLRTYLFSIGKHKLINYIRGEKEFVPTLEDIPVPKGEGLETEQQTIVNQYVKKLDEPCNRMLTLFYFERKNLKEIAKLMGYKSEQVAKNKRLVCAERLKRMIIEGGYSKKDFFDYE